MIPFLVPSSAVALVFLNTIAWLVAIFLPGTLIQGMSIRRFRERSFLFRIRAWERSGSIYRFLGVRWWKELLPDGAGIYPQGFKKRRMMEHDEFYLKRFILESCRAEFVHWIILAETPLFFLWNPFPSAFYMIPFSLAINLPCIIVQRYNRPRLRHLINMEKMRGKKQA
jgi:glycosyl-4,4'-diaponeurosporenoate acyltransferase